MPELADLPHDKYHELSDFIIQCIKDTISADGDGVEDKTLIQLCQGHFDEPHLPNDQSARQEKGLILATLKRMDKDEILESIQLSERMIFKLHPSFSMEDFEQDKENRPIEERDHAYSASKGRAMDTNMPDQQQDNEKTEAIRHSEAYVEMIRGAVPLVPTPPACSESPPETPSKKRRREIVASDSSFDSISPQRHSNSRPRPPLKRLCTTPLSGSRRRSAPNRLLNSPAKAEIPRQMQMQDYVDVDRVVFKKEKTNSSPAWLTCGLDNLRSKFPDDAFEGHGEGVKCFDCEGREFVTRGSVSNFERHLKSKQHRANVDARLAKCDTKEMLMPNHIREMIIPTKIMDFNIPPQSPLVVFAQNDDSSLADLGNQCFTAVENEIHAKNLQNSLLRDHFKGLQKETKEQISKLSGWQDALESKTNEKVRQISGSFEKLEQGSNEELRKMSDSIKRNEDRTNRQFQEMKNGLEKSDESFDDICRNMGTKLKDSEERSKDSISNLSGRLARSDQRNLDHLEEMKERNSKIERKMKAQLGRSEELAENMKVLGEKVKGLERANEQQNDLVHDLESQSQIQADELQRCRQSEESLRQETSDRMEAQFQQTAERHARFEKESTTRMEAMDKQYTGRIRSLDEKNQSLEKKNRSLEEKHHLQEQELERFRSVFPLVLQETDELRQESIEWRQEMKSLRRAIESSKARRPKSRRASIRSRPRVGHISRASTNSSPNSSANSVR